MAMRLPENQQRLLEVTKPSQEIIWHKSPRRTMTCHFYALVFVQTKQMSSKVLISEL